VLIRRAAAIDVNRYTFLIVIDLSMQSQQRVDRYLLTPQKQRSDRYSLICEDMSRIAKTMVAPISKVAASKEGRSNVGLVAGTSSHPGNPAHPKSEKDGDEEIGDIPPFAEAMKLGLGHISRTLGAVSRMSMKPKRKFRPSCRAREVLKLSKEQSIQERWTT
jgi:hypothetical protein